MKKYIILLIFTLGCVNQEETYLMEDDSRNSSMPESEVKTFLNTQNGSDFPQNSSDYPDIEGIAFHGDSLGIIPANITEYEKLDYLQLGELGKIWVCDTLKFDVSKFENLNTLLIFDICECDALFENIKDANLESLVIFFRDDCDSSYVISKIPYLTHVRDIEFHFMGFFPELQATFSSSEKAQFRDNRLTIERQLFPNSWEFSLRP